MAAKILVVDDERSIADPVLYALESEGFAADWRETAAGTLAALAEVDYALLVLDVGLPDGNGMDLCRTIRRQSTIPIIFLTARAGEVDRIVGLELGADDYMTKPFSPRELVARVKAVLRRTHAATPRSESVFFLDERAFTVQFCGSSLELTRYEFRLLAVLLQHPGRVFARDDLMRRVWEDCGSSMERTVDTHIKTIRAKLRDIRPDDDSIVTHRGVGYSLRLS